MQEVNGYKTFVTRLLTSLLSLPIEARGMIVCEHRDMLQASLATPYNYMPSHWISLLSYHSGQSAMLPSCSPETLEARYLRALTSSSSSITDGLFLASDWGLVDLSDASVLWAGGYLQEGGVVLYLYSCRVSPMPGSHLGHPNYSYPRRFVPRRSWR